MQIKKSDIILFFLTTLMLPIPLSFSNSKNLPIKAKELIGLYFSKRDHKIEFIDKGMKGEREQLVASLKKLEVELAKQGKYIQAQTVKEAIEKFAYFMLTKGKKVNTYSGSLSKHLPINSNRVVYYRVTASETGGIYGSGPYTIGSPLGKAALHSGLLKKGETGILKVTLIKGVKNFEGLKRNGVTSRSWTSIYPAYEIEKVQGHP